MISIPKNENVKKPLSPPERAILAIKQAVCFGRNEVLIAIGKEQQMISKRAAEKLFGRNYFKVWEQHHLIKGYKKGTGDNAKIEYSILELQQLQLSETYHYFMNDKPIKK